MIDTAQNIVNYLVERSKIPLARLSRDMGKSDTFLSTTFSKNSVLRMDTFLSLCKESGWKVKMIGHDEEFFIELPEKDQKTEDQDKTPDEKGDQDR